MKTFITVVAAAGFVAGAAVPALAQYYDRPPGYDQRPYDRPGYDRPGYDRPGYDRSDDGRRERFGRRCEAVLRTAEGPQQLFCRIVQPKPLGEECACPTPPGYGRRYAPGRTIR